MSMLKLVRTSFALDLRALAIMRMFIAITLFWDLTTRLPYIEEFHSDFGLLPRKELYGNFFQWSFSLFYAFDQKLFFYLLFILGYLIAAAVFIGYRTKLSIFLAWLLIVSIQNDNFLLLQGADILFVTTVFWAMFLPLGAKWSFDRYVHDQKGMYSEGIDEKSLLSVASIALILQNTGLYFCTAILKSSPVWWPKFDASWLALQLDQFATPFGVWLRQYKNFLHFATAAVYICEISCMFLILLPNVWIRGITVFAVIVMQLIFAFSLHLGLFPLANLTALVVLFPEPCFDFLENKITPFLIKSKILLEKFSSNSLMQLFTFYNQTPKLYLKNSLFTDVAVLFLAILCINWNLAETFPDHFNFPHKNFDSVMYGLRLNQRWDMFAPYPLNSSGWYVIPGTLRDGTQVDVWHQRYAEVSWEKPSVIADTYINQRWRKYLVNLSKANHSNDRLQLGRFLCRRWNRELNDEAKELKKFQIYFMTQRIKISEKSEPEKISLWTHHCF